MSKQEEQVTPLEIIGPEKTPGSPIITKRKISRDVDKTPLKISKQEEQVTPLEITCKS